MVPTNPDLASTWEIPGVYFSLNLSGQGSSISDLTKRLLVYGYRSSSGTQPPDSPVRCNGQSDADTFFGQGSSVARMFAAAQSQVGSGVLDIWCCGVNEPSGGTAATHLITVGGTATAAGFANVYLCGYLASVAIANGDTASVIATNLKAEIDKLKDLPATAGISSSTITLTARHKGLTGNDFPVRVDVTGATGVTFSPGTLTFANSATAGGSIAVAVSTSSVSANVNNSDTASTIGASVKAAINLGGFPVTATDDGSGVVTLYYAPGRYVHKISASLVTVTGTTITPAVGTAGAGTPSLSTSLTNIAALSAFPCWVTAFNDATSLGTISTTIETQGNGVNQKGQFVHFGSTDALATAGAIPTGTTPALTASPRYSLAWCPESPQQACELAARTAAAVCASDYAPQNFDGFALKTSGAVPLLLPPRPARPPESDQNSAIHTYYMTPLVVDEGAGALVILSGKTTSSSSNALLHDWGTIRHLDYLRVAFNGRLSSLFKGKNLRVNGTPRTSQTVNLQSIVNAGVVLAHELDDQDLFDGADQFKSAFAANVDAQVPTRVDCFIPLAVIRSLHQLGIVGAPV